MNPSVPSDIEIKGKILWVDDEPYILSAAKRLLEFHQFEVTTCLNPKEAFNLLSEKAYDVIVSDQRMPEVTGVELLTAVKDMYPQVTRLIVTGFSDKELLEEAINSAGVHRFISKPWDEQELVSDLKASVEHSIKKVRNLKLTQEIKIQNKKLMELTSNLEEIVLERTKEIQKSNAEIELRGKSIQELAHFTEMVHSINNFEELINYLNTDLKVQFKAVSPLLLIETPQKTNLMYYISKKRVRFSSVTKRFDSNSDIRFNDEGDRLELIDILKRPMGKMITLPLLKFSKEAQSNPVLFIEHELTDKENASLINYLTSRIQILSIVVDRISSNEKIKFESQKWEDTYDSLKEPLCIIDENKIVIRSNDSYDDEIQHIYADELEKLFQSKSIQIKRGAKIFDCYFYTIEFEDNMSHAIVYFKDITQEKLLHQSMIQTEKMSALGLLAGNIAHELNNPLTGIRSLAQILIREVKKEQTLSDLKEIEKASSRCQNVIHELQEFSAKGDIEKKEKVDLRKLIQKTLPFLKTALRSHNLELEFDEKECKIATSPQILQQVLFNVIINACQAMQDAGTIRIETQCKKNIISILVEDSGPGIPDDIKPYIFDPFFTTKTEGEGTGIGLSFCKSMIEKMDGKISFETKMGIGTIFKLEFPKA